MEAAGPERRCGLCLAGGASYTCPRCGLRYCSARCFGAPGHGSCARAFERRQLRGLRGEPDSASRRRLEEALLRLRAPREAGDAEAAPGPEEDEDEAEDELWARLSPEQRRAFERLLGSGEAAALLPPWRPWWEGGGRGAALVVELDGEPPLEPPSPAPAVPAPIPALGSLSRAPPSPLLPFLLPNVLFGYAFACALFQGDPQPLPDFCGALLDVSGALGARRVFRSTAEALQAALAALAAARYPQCVLGHAGVMLAVAQILVGPCQARQKDYALAALAHLSRLLGKGRKQVPAEDRTRLYRAKKKCDFLLSWVNENEQALVVLALEVQQEYKAHLDAAKEVGVVTRELEKMWGAKVPPPKKPLIEELDPEPQPEC